MSEKIYQLYLSKSYTEAYYQLSAEAKKSLWRKAEERVTSSGGKMLLACRSRWCDETYQSWGVIEYPDIKAVQRVADLDEKDEFFRYAQTQTLLGLPGDRELIPEMSSPDAVYQLYLINHEADNDEASLSPDVRKRMWAVVMESIDKHGGEPGLWCHADWSNEEIDVFGITAWPSVEAVQAHFADMAKIGFHRYVHARTILGRRVGAG